MKQNKELIATLAAFVCGMVVSLVLLAPGVWWGDSLNAYIQSATGIFGTAQPVTFTLICSVSRHIYPGTLPIFLFCITLYYLGFSALVFYNITSFRLSTPVFFLLGFWPVLFANIGVIQTESLQLGILSFFVAAVFMLHKYEGKYKKLLLVGLAGLLILFSLIRFDSLLITIMMGYWLSYTYLKTHGYKAIAGTVAILASFFVIRAAVDKASGIAQENKSQMSVSLLIADIAAISAESEINYIPDYCWQEYMPASERTTGKVKYGLVHWKYSFYSYIYNVDPTIGLFRYEVSSHDSETMATWLKVVTKHPFFYIKFHFSSFWYFLTGDNFNMGLWSGLKDSHKTMARLAVERSGAVDTFLQQYPTRFAYTDGEIVVTDDSRPISIEEKAALIKLVDERRISDVQWMEWNSSIPQRVYVQDHAITEKYVNPFFDFFKHRFRLLAFMGSYLAGLVLLFLVFRNRIKDSYKRTTFWIFCLSGIIHLSSRFIFITDPVYRFGIVAILFLFFAVVIVVSDFEKYYKRNELA